MAGVRCGRSRGDSGGNAGARMLKTLYDSGFRDKVLQNKMARPITVAAGAVLGGGLPLQALAQEGHGRNWQLGFLDPVTPVATRMQDFHTMLLWIIAGISLFVVALLVIVLVRFNEKANPTPSKTTHNTLIEVLWTAVPVLILVFIGFPSLRLLFFTDQTVDADMTIKAIGRQWYWSYQYPDHGDFEFDAFIIPDDELQPGQLRLLETDNRVVVPVGKKVRLLTTSSDVLHAFAVPAFGVKMDSVPGRTNETWFQVDVPGVYYGQCSELCGTGHGFMPITIEAVPEEQFDAWVVDAQAEFATSDDTITDQRPIRVSEAQFVRPALQ